MCYGTMIRHPVHTNSLTSRPPAASFHCHCSTMTCFHHQAGAPYTSQSIAQSSILLCIRLHGIRPHETHHPLHIYVGRYFQNPARTCTCIHNRWPHRQLLSFAASVLRCIHWPGMSPLGTSHLRRRRAGRLCCSLAHTHTDKCHRCHHGRQLSLPIHSEGCRRITPMNSTIHTTMLNCPNRCHFHHRSQMPRMLEPRYHLHIRWVRMRRH